MGTKIYITYGSFIWKPIPAPRASLAELVEVSKGKVT